jgi:hypothetical protein
VIVCLGCVLYLIASNVGAGWLYVVVAAIGGVTLVSAPLPWWGVRGVKVARRAPAVATAGEPFECSLEVENTGRLARHVLEVEDRFAGDTGRAVVVRARPGRPEVVRYAVENPRRGVYAGGDAVVESRAPFGLSYGRRRRWAATSTVVYPRTFGVAPFPPAVVADAGRGDGSEASTLHRGHGGEFWGIREYRAGDPARLVAWKRSARGLPTGKLAVVELAREARPPLVLAMNLDDSAPREALEMVISAGASLLVHGLGEGREVGADAGPDNPPFPEDPSPDGVLAWCAGLRASRPPDPGGLEGADVEVRPSTRGPRAAGQARPAGLCSGAGARTVVLVSCHEFAGPSETWMSPEEEREFVEMTEAGGRRAARLGADVAEPWSLG